MTLNAAYFAALTAQVNAINKCSELQSVVDEAFDALKDVNSGLTAQIARIAPILALLEAPDADLTKIVTWITNFITNYLAPGLAPYAVMIEQQAEMIAAVASLTTAIENAATRIGGSCEITIPPIV